MVEMRSTDNHPQSVTSLISPLKSVGPVYERTDVRGKFLEIINQGLWEGIHYGEMAENSEIGGKYHKKNKAFIFILEGSAELISINSDTKNTESIILNPFEGAHLRSFYVNTIRFLTRTKFILLKSNKFDPLDHDSYSL